jgi:hypothetical protein
MAAPSLARRGRSDERGAVMVESLVAIPTLLAFFAMIVQLAYLSIASLTVQHAAVVAARSASVIVPDMPTAFDDHSKVGAADGDRLAAVTEAASKVIAALKPLPSLSLQGDSAFQPDAKVALLKDGKEATDFEPEAVIQARVEYEYQCAVMFGGSLICGADGKVTLTAIAAMPNQGASYGYY